MVKSCCVKNCRSTITKLKKMHGVSFHLLPKSNSEVLSKWLEFLNYGNDWKPLKSSSICSLHFTERDFRLGTNLRMLKTSAVPSICVSSKITTASSQVNKIEPQEIIIPDEPQGPEDFGTCRLCSLEFKYGLTNIFDANSNYSYQIYKCLHITVSPGETLPTFICYSCRQKLNDLEHFIDDVMKAQEILNNKNNLLADGLQGELSFNRNESMQENYPHCHMDTRLSKVCHNDMEENCQRFNSLDKPSISIIPVEFSNPDNSSIRNDITRDTLLHPIKLEIASNREILGKSQFVPSNSDRLNKKIEILEDIKIEPPLNQIAYKSFKSIYDESLSTINRTVAQKVVPSEVPKIPNNILPKKKVVKERNKLLSKSTAVCNGCKAKFISKYALNHHVKHLCPKKDTIVAKPPKPKKIKKTTGSETLIATHNAKILPNSNNTVSQKPFKTKQRRKPILTIKSEYY